MNKKPVKEEEKIELSPERQAASFMGNKESGFLNHEEDIYYHVRCSSLILSDELDGGLTPGCHRMVGITSGGKSSCALDFMYHFLRETKRRGVYFRCEGRLSPKMRERSGIKFCNKPLDWEDQTCLVADTIVYEDVFGFIDDLISNNPSKTKYFFIIDSTDAMKLMADLKKPLTDCGKMAAGGLITSVFLAKKALEVSKRGHIAVFISQVREHFNPNARAAYLPPPPTQGKASGGHALEHNANIVLEFLSKDAEKYQIRKPGEDKENREKEGDKSGKVEETDEKGDKPPALGHWCRVRLVKTDNENNGLVVKYPIKHHRTGGNSVWKELEIIYKLEYYALMKKSSSWLIFEDSLVTELKKVDKDFPEKIQGRAQLLSMLEDNINILDYLYTKFSFTTNKNEIQDSGGESSK